MYRLIDTHAHLDEIDDLAAALAAARQAGVMAVIAVGVDLESNKKTLRLTEEYPGFVYPALGFHPWNIAAAEIDATLGFIADHVSEAVAVGEIGLDYHKKVREKADKDLQKQVLQGLLKLARDNDKPALVHSRYAWRDALDAVTGAGVGKAVFHWYTGTSSVLRDIIGGGYYISATPAIEYHEEHRRAVREAPLNRLMLETDAPVVYRRGSEFEFEAGPADAARSLKGAAALHGVSEAEMAGATTANAMELFNLEEGD